MGLLHDLPADHAERELARLATLASLRIMDTPPEREFDTLVEMARMVMGTPIAAVSLVDDHRQWFKARCGLANEGTPREEAFCAHAIAEPEMLVIPDARLDARFRDHPGVVGAPFIRFYAGAPLRVGEPAMALGTLCVVGREPLTPSAEQLAALRNLAHVAETLLRERAHRMVATHIAEERSSVLQALDRSHRQFRQAERIANIGSWRMTLANQAIEWSDHVYVIHELPVGEQPPLERALDFYPPHERAAVTAALNRTLETGQPFDVEVDFITARGAQRRVRSMGEVELQDGQPVALVGVFQDITDRYALEQVLRRTAQTDDLTRLASRARLNELLDEQIVRCRAERRPLAVLLIDLDNFKTVNDRCGHHAGDDLLRMTASKLQAAALGDSFAARLGGDEFVMIVDDPEVLADLPAALRRLTRELKHSVSCDGGAVHASGTIGAAWLEDDVPGRSELLQRADAALYRAKRIRRGSAMIHGQAALILPEGTHPVIGLRAAGVRRLARVVGKH